MALDPEKINVTVIATKKRVIASKKEGFGSG